MDGWLSVSRIFVGNLDNVHGPSQIRKPRRRLLPKKIGIIHVEIGRESPLKSPAEADTRDDKHQSAQRLGEKCDRATTLSAVAGMEHVVRDLTP
jgi:hypothetical protein